MKLVIFVHPEFLGSTSMPLFADMIVQGAATHGHQAEKWAPRPFFWRLPVPRAIRKWLGYLDQYIVFPLQVRNRLRRLPQDTLFVFADQALGPWVPLVAHRPHVIHCHDFLALRSALGEIPMNPVSWTGRIYQRWIRKGFSRGRNFISVSGRTRSELHRFLAGSEPELSMVVYNGLNHPYRQLPAEESHSRLRDVGLAHPEKGFILHVGGNQWYKNRDGLLAIYAAYVRRAANPLPLVMLGAAPDHKQWTAAERLSALGKVEFIVRPPTPVLEAAYSAASALLFPSHAEGFGWPIIEAMACGCPVLTTDDAPMTEVGGDVADYLPKAQVDNMQVWADACAGQLIEVLCRPAEEREARRQAGITRAQGFSADDAIRRYLDVYAQVLGNVGP